MMKMRSVPCALCIGVLSFALAGCQTTPTVHRQAAQGPQQPTVHYGLVMPSEAMVLLGQYGDLDHGWEASRNDPPSYREAVPDYSDRAVVELRHREHLRTSNGRPREYTSTTTRVWQRRGVRWPYRGFSR